MPSLMTVIGANANPFRKELASTAGIASLTGKQIVASLSATALHLESQIVLAKRASTSWAIYETELLAVNAQLAVLKKQEAAAIVAGIGAAAAGSKEHVKGLSGVIGELLVIMREVGRGNWSRVPGSISILTQRLGFLKYILNPIGAALLAAGGAAFFFFHHLKAVNEQLDKTGELYAKGFGNMQKSMADATRDASAAAADFNDWLKELGKSHEDLSDKTEETLRKMREEARLRNQLAADKGASKKDIAAAELKDLDAELKVLTSAKIEQRRIAEQSRNAAIDASRASATSPEAIARQGRIKDIPHESEQLQAEIKLQRALVSSLQDKVEGKVANQPLFLSSIGINPKSDEGQKLLRQATETAADTLFEVDHEGQKYRLSLSQATGLLQGLQKQQVGLAKEEARLAGVQRELADITRDSKKKSESDQKAVEKLEKERSQLATDIGIKKKYLPEIAAAEGRTLLHGRINSLQSMGAFATPGQILDVNKRMAKHLESIDRKIERNLATSHRSSPFGHGQY